MKNKLRVFISGALLLCLPILSPADDIRIGMTAALSGPSGNLGQHMKAGLELGFSEINASGGIKGRKFRLIALDDGYKPLEAAKNMRELIYSEKVLAVVGNTGTPTAALTVPIANESKTLLLGAYTGADLLRKSKTGCCIYNYRASYRQESSMMIEHILKSGIKPKDIAFFTQNDAYGDAGYSTAQEKLKSIDFTKADQLPHVRYRRNTLNVEQAVADILTLKITPKVIVMVGSYGASAKFIKLLKPELPNTKFYNISFTGSAALLNNLSEHAEGVFITEVVPDMNSDVSIAKQYREALKQHGEAGSSNVISFEGYIVSRLLVEGFKSIKGDVNRGSILAAMNDIDCSLLGNKSTLGCFSGGNRQASQTVWLNKVVEGKFDQMDVKISDESSKQW